MRLALLMIVGIVGDLTWRSSRSAGYRILRLLQGDLNRWRREYPPVKLEDDGAGLGFAGIQTDRK
ncbi:hypothetical protein ELI55_04710 [Rhizobium ruizarguesonis]|nr:hypothetical protein [Rhizobium leguminosarum bv. viciae]TAU04234.1 hypothetical protein ELI55_04710 [Rhizobium ruizarguesonis]TAU30401.1 hypothetical protein ELI47_04535 [Rhizobium ruizarguesonis]TBD20364.1 hypothetical protein ELH23_05470 [Rhizobium ruizarguesonis]